MVEFLPASPVWRRRAEKFGLLGCCGAQGRSLAPARIDRGWDSSSAGPWGNSYCWRTASPCGPSTCSMMVSGEAVPSDVIQSLRYQSGTNSRNVPLHSERKT